MTYTDQIQVAASRLLNAILFGDCDEMLSSRAYRTRAQNPWLYSALNLLFFWQGNHCKQSYDWEWMIR